MSVRLSVLKITKQSMRDKVLEGVIFYISGKNLLSDEFTFEQRPEWREGVSHKVIWDKRASGRENSMQARVGRNQIIRENREIEKYQESEKLHLEGHHKDSGFYWVRQERLAGLSRGWSDITYFKQPPSSCSDENRMKGSKGGSRETSCGVTVTIHRRDDDGSDQVQMMRRRFL